MATKKRSAGARASKAGRVPPNKTKKPTPPKKRAVKKTAKKAVVKKVKTAKRRAKQSIQKAKASRVKYKGTIKDLARAFAFAGLLLAKAEKELVVKRTAERQAREDQIALERLEKLRADQEQEGFVRPQEWTRRDGSAAARPCFLRHLDTVDELIHYLETGERNFQTPMLGLIADIDKKVIYDKAKFHEIVQQIKEETGARSLREVYTLFYSP